MRYCVCAFVSRFVCVLYRLGVPRVHKLLTSVLVVNHASGNTAADHGQNTDGQQAFAST